MVGGQRDDTGDTNFENCCWDTCMAVFVSKSRDLTINHLINLILILTTRSFIWLSIVDSRLQTGEY